MNKIILGNGQYEELTNYLYKYNEKIKGEIL